MFGSLGVPELIFIFVLALLVFGPKKLPELGRTLGKAMAEFRKATTDLQRTINAELMEQELRDSDPRRAVRDSLRDAKQSLQASLDGPSPPKDNRAPTNVSEPPVSLDKAAATPDPAENVPALEGVVARGVLTSAEAPETHDQPSSSAST